MTTVWAMDIPATDKMVLLALADAANDDGVTWIAVQSKRAGRLDLLQKCSLSERAIQGAIRRLCDAGHLSRDERVGRGVIYRVTPAAGAPPQQMRPAADAGTPAADAGKPFTNRNNPPEAKASSGSRARKPRPEPEGFAEFWSAYPVKKGRLKAVEAYRRAIGIVGGHDPPGQLVAAVERAKASDAQWARGFVPHPTTWLNAGGWLDEPQTDDRPDNRFQTAQPDARRANTESRRNAWADVVAERHGEPAGADGDGGREGGVDRSGASYPRLAHTGTA